MHWPQPAQLVEFSWKVERRPMDLFLSKHCEQKLLVLGVPKCPQPAAHGTVMMDMADRELDMVCSDVLCGFAGSGVRARDKHPEKDISIIIGASPSLLLDSSLLSAFKSVLTAERCNLSWFELSPVSPRGDEPSTAVPKD